MRCATGFAIFPRPGEVDRAPQRGGRKGLIVNSRNLCRGKNRAKANLKGQNGRLSRTKPVVRAVKCGKRGAKRSSHHRRGRR